MQIKSLFVKIFKSIREMWIKDIEDALTKRLSCQVELTNLLDSRLIGGIKVVIEDKVFDGSIKNKLERLKQSLISGGI